MLALVWLALATWCGWLVRVRFLPSARALLASRQVPAPAYDLPAALVLGTIPLATLTFAFASASMAVAPDADPLAVANGLGFACVIGAILLMVGRGPSAPWRPGVLTARLDAWADGVAGLWSPGRRRRTVAHAAAVALFVAFGWLVSWSVFAVKDGTLAAGYTVFSDYATHIAAVSSFARGENFAPTTYPHFAGDGVQHHFFFFFLAGNLQYLGLPIDWALNVPSLLGTVAFFSLLGAIAVAWSGRTAAFLLAPLLVMLRPGMAGFTHLAGGVAEDAAEKGVSAWDAFWTLDRFVGNLPNDSWGLWNLNVFANQRHLLFGLAAALVVLVIFAPAFRRGRLLGSRWLSRQAWTPTSWRPYVPALVLAAVFAYWHGSVLITLLMLLAWLALFARDKLAFAAMAVVAVVSSLVLTRVFSGTSGGVVEAGIVVGFIAEDKSPVGMLAYLAELTGPWLLATLIALVWARSRMHRWLHLGLLLPIVFTFTVSLTPDVTVNHKYLLIAIMLGAVPIADLVLRLWSGALALPYRLVIQRRDHQASATPRRPIAWEGRLLAGLLVAALTFTGVVDLIGYRNTNERAFTIEYEGAFQHWVQNNTDARDIVLTPAWHYHPFFLSGRQVWFGHGYYAWSAGHATRVREAEVKLLWNGWRNPDGSAPDPTVGGVAAGLSGDEGFDRYVRENGIRYAIITESLRTNENLTVDEEWFQSRFPVVAEFPANERAVIYQLY